MNMKTRTTKELSYYPWTITWTTIDGKRSKSSLLFSDRPVAVRISDAELSALVTVISDYFEVCDSA